MKIQSTHIQKLLSVAFFTLFFFTPLIVLPQTTEFFEFNKMVFVYGMTIIISGLWVLLSLSEQRFVFKRTALDIPLMLFLLSQTISTFTSIDLTTSLLGYYGRFHGGLASTVSYILLYWIYGATMDREATIKVLKILIVSALLVCGIAFFEHFGTSATCIIFTDPSTSFNKACWSQDFQTRVFSTLGQPNWLAAWLAALLPLSIGLILNRKSTSLKKWLIPQSVLPILILTIIIFTKSKSGLIAVAIVLVFYTIQIFRFFKFKFHLRRRTITLSLLSVGLCMIPILLTAIPKFNNSNKTDSEQALNQTIVITDSFTIRKIVWQGALGIWRDYPILGSGVETFALVFPRYQPIEINRTSEWDFVFNKAHNEYLHILSTSGLVGLIAYLSVCIVALRQIAQTSSNDRTLPMALFSGFMAILITNISSFSVVVIGLLFFLFPAFSVGLTQTFKPTKGSISPLSVIVVLLVFSFPTNFVYQYWTADTHYKASSEALSDWKLADATTEIKKSLSLNSREPLYWEKQSEIDSHFAVALFESGQSDHALKLSESALIASDYALSLSPKNTQLVRKKISILVRLSIIDSSLLSLAESEFETLITDVTTNPELHYNYALLHLKTGKTDDALEHLSTAIDLKSNYKEPRFARALILSEQGKNAHALEEVIYIRSHIDPFDEDVNALFDKLNRENSN